MMLGNKMSWDFYLKTVSGLRPIKEIEPGRIEFQVRTHYPEVQHYWTSFMALTKKIAEICAEYAQSKDTGNPNRPDLIVPSISLIKELQTASELLKAKIIEHTPLA